MNTKRIVSIVTALIVTAAFMLVTHAPVLTSDGTIRDDAVSSEVVLAHELVHANHAQ